MTSLVSDLTSQSDIRDYFTACLTTIIMKQTTSGRLSSLLLRSADWKFENIWHDTVIIWWPLIGQVDTCRPSHWPWVTITHLTGLSLVSCIRHQPLIGLWILTESVWESSPDCVYIPPYFPPLLTATQWCRHSDQHGMEGDFRNNTTLCNEEVRCDEEVEKTFSKVNIPSFRLNNYRIREEFEYNTQCSKTGHDNCKNLYSQWAPNVLMNTQCTPRN